MSGAKILRIGAVVFTLVGGFLVIWQYFSGRAPGYKVFFFVLTVAGIIALVYVLFSDIRSRFAPVERLHDERSIQRSFERMLSDARRIVFVGALDAPLAKAIVKRWNSRSAGEDLGVRVYNSDPSFYRDAATVADEMAKHDAEHESFRSRFLFYRQAADSLAVVRQKDKSEVLLRWRDGTGQAKGVRLRHTGSPSEDFLREVPVATIDDVYGKQAPELESVITQFEEYCRPLKSGWSYPVLPLPEWESVQADITAHNLKWFNDVATRLIEYGAPHRDNVSVTWYLHDGSARDCQAFAQWLRKLATSAVTVNRYVFIDTDRYRANESYKAVVRQIDNTYFGKRELRSAYTMHYVPVHELARRGIPAEDFALFNLQTGIWAQSSVLNSAPSGRKFVRVWFCRSAPIRKKYTGMFDILDEHGTAKYATLAELDAAIGPAEGKAV